MIHGHDKIPDPYLVTCFVRQCLERKVVNVFHRSPKLRHLLLISSRSPMSLWNSGATEEKLGDERIMCYIYDSGRDGGNFQIPR